MKVAEQHSPPWLDRTPWGWVVGATVLLISALVATSTFYRVSDWEGAPPFLELLAWQGLVWAPWLLLARYLPRLAARFPFESAGMRDFGVHLLVSFGLTAIHVLWFVSVSTTLSPLQGMENTRYGVFKFFFVFFFQLDLLLYWVLVGFALTRVKQRALVERQRREAQLEIGLAEARLRALQLQIRPHFLFNALNTIVAMQRQGEVERATSMTVALSDMLRLLLVRDEKREVTVKDELALLESYLEIEGYRFGDRLEVILDVDPAARSLMMPTLSLQPLVENAIHHGAASFTTEPTSISIFVERDGESLKVRISNSCEDGRRGEPGLGIGLDNLRTRLQELYGDQGCLAFEEVTNERHVRLTIPATSSEPGTS